MTNLFYSLLAKIQGQKGQGLVEYALIIAVVSVLIIASLVTLRGNIEGTFSDIGAALNPA